MRKEKSFKGVMRRNESLLDTKSTFGNEILYSNPVEIMRKRCKEMVVG